MKQKSSSAVIYINQKLERLQLLKAFIQYVISETVLTTPIFLSVILMSKISQDGGTVQFHT